MSQASVMTVAILFSGGDAPGMKKRLRAFVRLGLIRQGARILAIKDGFWGLVSTCNRIDAHEINEKFTGQENHLR